MAAPRDWATCLFALENEMKEKDFMRWDGEMRMRDKYNCAKKSHGIPRNNDSQ